MVLATENAVISEAGGNVCSNTFLTRLLYATVSDSFYLKDVEKAEKEQFQWSC